MAVDPQATWASTLDALPKVADGSWAQNFANWYAGRISGITTKASVVIPVGFVFTFNAVVFKNNLSALAPTTSASAGINGFADAWVAAMNASIVVAATGTSGAPASPATTFSAIASAVIDPPSVLLAKAKLQELISAPAVDDGLDSEFPVKFRDATLLLTMTLVGTNSVAPSPSPLTIANVPLI